MVLALVATIISSSYFDAPDGSISIVPEGGQSPYTYLWDDPAADTTPLIVVAAGVYTVIVTDAVNATVTEVYTVTQPLTFDLRIEPYGVALLSDTIIRDLFCRKVISEGYQLIGRGKAAQSFYIRGAGASYDTIGTIIGGKEPDGTGGLTMSVYDHTSAYDVVHITTAGVTIKGDLTIAGSTTQVVVNDIVVNDKTIHLSANQTTSGGVDGSGVLIGLGSVARSMLYSSAVDAFSFDSSVYLQGSGSLRVGDTWSSSSFLTKNSFSVSNGVPAISLNGTGLTLTNCLLVDPIPITEQIASDHGITHLASGKYFGWDSIESLWATSGDGIGAKAFVADAASFSGTGLIIPVPNSTDTVKVNTSGLEVGTAASVTLEGLDLVSNDAQIYFGNRAWRFRYDVVENALVFEKLQNGSYITKLTID